MCWSSSCATCVPVRSWWNFSTRGNAWLAIGTPSQRPSQHGCSVHAHHGPAPAQVVETILASRVHSQLGFRSGLGIMRLDKRYSAERLEDACQRALTLGACADKSLESIL